MASAEVLDSNFFYKQSDRSGMIDWREPKNSVQWVNLAYDPIHFLSSAEVLSILSSDKIPNIHYQFKFKYSSHPLTIIIFILLEASGNNYFQIHENSNIIYTIMDKLQVFKQPEHSAFLYSSSYLFNKQRVQIKKANQQIEEERKKRIEDAIPSDVSQYQPDRESGGKQSSIPQLLKNEMNNITKMITELERIRKGLSQCQCIYEKMMKTDYRKGDQQFLISVMKKYGYIRQDERQVSLGKILQELKHSNISYQQQNIETFLENYRQSRIPIASQLCSISLRQADAKDSRPKPNKRYQTDQQDNLLYSVTLNPTGTVNPNQNKKQSNLQNRSEKTGSKQNKNTEVSKNQSLNEKEGNDHKEAEKEGKIHQQSDIFKDIKIPISKHQNLLQIIEVQSDRFLTKMNKIVLQVHYSSIEKVILFSGLIMVNLKGWGEFQLKFTNENEMTYFFRSVYGFAKNEK